jgi:hypothetical protein
MISEHCTSLDTAIREGRIPAWYALPVAAGFAIYATVALAIALVTRPFHRGSRKVGPLAGMRLEPTGEFRPPRKGEYYHDAGAGGICLCCRRKLPTPRAIFRLI